MSSCVQEFSNLFYMEVIICCTQSMFLFGLTFGRFLELRFKTFSNTLHLIQKMNSLAAALSVGLFCVLLLYLTDNLKMSIFGTLALGKQFPQQQYNSNQSMQLLE